MEHPFGVGDSVQVYIQATEKLVTARVVVLPNEHGVWEVRVDGESTTRRVRVDTMRPLAAPKPIKRRPPPKKREPLPVPEWRKKEKLQKKDNSWPDAHPNELRKGPNYDRNTDEDLTLSDEGASYQGKPVPPPFRRGLTIRNLPMSSDGWSPENWMQKPPDCEKSFEELCETWADEQDAGDLKKWESDCVWGWRPGKKKPPWWRIRFHEDDTYTVLCLCFVYNFRCYQPALGQDFTEFLREALKNDKAARALNSVNEKLRAIAEDDWLAKHRKPTKCPWPDCGIPFAQLPSDQIHFDHQALTRHGRNYYCKPCNNEGQALYDAMGPKRAGEIIEAAVLHTSFKGCFITMPLAPDS